MSDNTKKSTNTWSLTEVLSGACKSVVPKAMIARIAQKNGGEKKSGFDWAVVSEEGERISSEEITFPGRRVSDSGETPTTIPFPKRDISCSKQTFLDSGSELGTQNVSLHLRFDESHTRGPFFPKLDSAPPEAREPLFCISEANEISELLKQNRTFDPEVMFERLKSLQPTVEEEVPPAREKRPTAAFRSHLSKESDAFDAPQSIGVPEELLESGDLLSEPVVVRSLEMISDKESEDEDESGDYESDERTIEFVSRTNRQRQRSGQRARVRRRRISETVKTAAENSEAIGKLAEIWPGLPEHVRNTILEIALR